MPPTSAVTILFVQNALSTVAFHPRPVAALAATGEPNEPDPPQRLATSCWPSRGPSPSSGRLTARYGTAPPSQSQTTNRQSPQQRTALLSLCRRHSSALAAAQAPPRTCDLRPATTSTANKPRGSALTAASPPGCKRGRAPSSGCSCEVRNVRRCWVVTVALSSPSSVLREASKRTTKLSSVGGGVP